jgi:hypothetical protein
MGSHSYEPPDPGREHPVTVFAERLATRLDDLAGVPLTSMDAAAKRRALVALATARGQLDALALRLLADAEASQACVGSGAASAAGWLAVQTRQTRLEARSDLRLGTSLESLPALSAGMAGGVVNTAQARAIVAALDRLPRRGEFAVSAVQLVEAEAHLVALAATHDAAELKALGRSLFQVIAPEEAEQLEGRALEAEEAKAARRTSLRMWEDDEGTCHGQFRIPTRHGQMLRKAIQSLTNPVRPGSSAHSPIDRDLPAPVRNGIAFTQVLEAIDAHWLPTSGGVGATVVVTMTYQQLVADLEAAGVCSLDTGTRMSAAEARRLACRAGIIPVVLGSPSVVLDAGRKTRFHTEPMRVALTVRDGGCAADGCDVPPSMCHAHHDLPFGAGGPTSVVNGRLLCGHHHRRIHDPAYEHTDLASGKVAFHRRT